MVNNIFQTNFSNGEISPHLHARVDIDLYASGAKTIRNFFVKAQAGVTNRAGTEFVGVCRGQNLDASVSDSVRLIPFQFNEQDSYVLEFGHKYMRVVRQGGYVLETDSDSNLIQRSIASITTADEAVVTIVTDGTKPVYGSGSHVQVIGAYKKPRFDDGSQDIRTSSVVSEKIIDLGSDYKNIEDEISFRCVVGTSFVGSGTCSFQVQTSDSRLFTTYETLYASSAWTSSVLESGAIRINNVVSTEYKRYVRLYYEVGGSGFTAGTVVGTLLVNGTNSIPYEEINNKIYIVSDRVGDTMKLKYFDGAYLDTSEYFEASANSGRLQRIFTKSMPYTGADLHLLKFVQDADVMTITHPDYPPYNLTRQGHAIWSLEKIEFKPPLLAPVDVAVSSTMPTNINTDDVKVSAITTYRYVVTCVNKQDQESRPSAVVSTVCVAMTTPLPADYGSSRNTITWSANSGAKRYKIYRQQEVAHGAPAVGSMYGYVGHTESTSFVDQNISPDFTQGPPELYNPFAPVTAKILNISKANPAGVLYSGTPSDWAEGDTVYIAGIKGMTEFVDGYYTIRTKYTSSGDGMTFNDLDGNAIDSSDWSTHTSSTGTIQKNANSPSCSAYYQQRRVFAGSIESPQGVWMTRTGDYDNMDIRYPVRDDDSIEFFVTSGSPSGQINQIKHLISTQSLLALTLSGAFRISGADSGGSITPSSINVKPQSVSTGANDVVPIVMNTDVLYVQSKGSTVRALAYDFYSDAYKADDISFRSKHLLEASPIREWAYANEPNNVVYAVREDGKILMLTYLKEAQTIAWSWGDSEGTSGRDRFRSVCCVSENGEDVVYFVVSRYICNERGCKFYKYLERMHTRNLYTDGKLDIKKAFFVDSGKYYEGTPIDRMEGLDHLEGCEVSILLDGSVQPPSTVRNGVVRFNRYGSFVVVGLPYVSELETLPLDRGGMNLSGKMKTINRVTARVVNTRGIEIGHDDEDMQEVPETQYPNTEIPPLFTGDREVMIGSLMSQTANVKVRQRYPLPAEISGLILEVELGDT